MTRTAMDQWMRVGMPKELRDAFNKEAVGVVGAKLIDLGIPALAAVDAVHAAFDADDPSNDFPGPFTDPDVPRNLQVDFGDDWDGGDVTITGIDQFGTVITEVFVTNPGTARVGAKIFAAVTAAQKAAVGVGGAAPSATIGTKTKLGVSERMSNDFVMLTVDGVAEAAQALLDYHSVSPTTAPDGAKQFILLANVEDAAEN